MFTDAEKRTGGDERDALAGIFQLQAQLFIDRRLANAQTRQEQQLAISIAIEAGLAVSVLIMKSADLMGVGGIDVEDLCECLRRHAARPILTEADLKRRAN